MTAQIIPTVVRQQGFGNEEAKDIVQEFLASALQRGMIPRADPLPGRFRTFLLSSLTNFLRDRHRNGGRLKRGGGHAPVSLAQFEVEPRYARAVHTGEPPQTIIDRNWAKGFLGQCISELEGKSSHLQAFEMQMQGVDCMTIAKATGLSQTGEKRRSIGFASGSGASSAPIYAWNMRRMTRAILVKVVRRSWSIMGKTFRLET